MTIQSVKLVSESICLLVVAGCAVYAVHDLHQTQIQARSLLYHADHATIRAEGVESKVYATMTNIDGATKVWKESSKEQANAVLDVTRSAGVTIGKVGNMADAGIQTAHSASGVLQTTETTVASLQAPINQSTALLASLTRTGDRATKAVDNFNVLISQPSLIETLENVQGITANGNAIAADFRKVADHETEEFLKPVKWYMQPVKKGSQLIDILAAISRHTP